MPYAAPLAYREYQRNYQREYQRNKRQWLVSLKRDIPCAECSGIFHPAAMEWHHRDPSTKIREVSGLTSYSKKAILDEIAKCDLMCANCHAVVTYNQKLEQATSTLAV